MNIDEAVPPIPARPASPSITAYNLLVSPGGAAAFFILLSFLKTPTVLFHGRMQAEEGEIWLNDMYSRDFAGALTYVYKGTIQILTALATWFAAKSPIAIAPFITTYAGLAVQAWVAALMVLWGRDNRIRPAVVFVLVWAWAMLPTTYEIWANSIDIQWTCSVSMLLMLLLSPERLHRGFLGWLIWAAVCGMTGVPSCMLAPAFLAKGVVQRSRPYLSVGAVLSICALVQMAVIVVFGIKARSLSPEPLVILLTMAIQTVLVPVAGVHVMQQVLHAATSWPKASLAQYASAGAIVLAGLAVALVPLATLFRDRRYWLPTALVVFLWVLVTSLNLFGGLGNARQYISVVDGSRYYLFGAVCFCLLLAMAASSEGAGGAMATICLGLVCLTGCTDRLPGTWLEPFVQGPSWQEQVARCQKGRSCTILTWPYPVTWRPNNAPWFVHTPANWR